MKKLVDGKKIAPVRNGPWAFRYPVVLVFFLVFFFYVWLRLEPALEYYSAGVVFSWSSSFLHRFLDYPGGLVEYGAAFLAQLNYLNWLGALVFTLLGVLLFLMADGLCRRAAGRAPLFICLAPALTLLAWRGQYDGRTLEASLMLLLAYGAALAYVPVFRRPSWLRWPVIWCLGAALYYAAGLWSFLLLLFLAGWLEGRQSRKWLKVAVLVGLGVLLGPVGWHVLQLPEPHFNPFGTGRALRFAGVLFLLLPIGLLVLLWRRKPLAPAPTPAVQSHKRAGSKHHGLQPAGWGWSWGEPAFAIGLLLAGWVVVWSLFDGTRNKLGLIGYYAALQQDERLLSVAAQLRTMTPQAEVRLRLALYHTGRLTQDLFAFPNSGKKMLLPGMSLGMGTARAEIETLLELGQVNEAEHLAQESLEFDGERPDVLRVLAQVNILKDRPEAAAVFLNVLRQVPFQRDWATACLAELEHNPRLNGNPELDLVRSRMPTTDFPHGTIPDAAEDLLRQLLASNRQNHMACEYLLTHYLLTGEFKKLARQVGQLEGFGYTVIPRPVEEALVLGQKLQGLEFELHGLKIQPDTLRRFQSFCDALGEKTGQAPVALAALAPDFGDTFWYYYYTRFNAKTGDGS
jgi:hypothetical protein